MGMNRVSATASAFIEVSCGECCYFSSPGGTIRGMCLRHAPTIKHVQVMRDDVIYTDSVSEWPSVTTNDGCGDFRQRE